MPRWNCWHHNGWCTALGQLAGNQEAIVVGEGQGVNPVILLLQQLVLKIMVPKIVIVKGKSTISRGFFEFWTIPNWFWQMAKNIKSLLFLECVSQLLKATQLRLAFKASATGSGRAEPKKTKSDGWSQSASKVQSFMWEIERMGTVFKTRWFEKNTLMIWLPVEHPVFWSVFTFRGFWCDPYPPTPGGAGGAR